MRTHVTHAGEVPVNHPHAHHARRHYLEVPAKPEARVRSAASRSSGGHTRSTAREATARATPLATGWRRNANCEAARRCSRRSRSTRTPTSRTDDRLALGGGAGRR